MSAHYKLHSYDTEHLERVFALSIDAVQDFDNPRTVWQPELEAPGGLTVQSRDADDSFRWYRALFALDVPASFAARNLVVDYSQEDEGFNVTEAVVDAFPGTEADAADPDGVGRRVTCVSHVSTYFGIEINEFVLYASRRLPDGSALAVKPTAALVDGVWTSSRFRERLRSLTVYHVREAAGSRPFGEPSRCCVSVMFYFQKTPHLPVLRVVPDFWIRRVASRILANYALRIKRALLKQFGALAGPPAGLRMRMPFASGSTSFCARPAGAGGGEAPWSPMAHLGEPDSPFVVHACGLRAAQAQPADGSAMSSEAASTEPAVAVATGAGPSEGAESAEAENINALFRRLVGTAPGGEPPGGQLQPHWRARERPFEFDFGKPQIQEALRASLDLSLRLASLSLGEERPPERPPPFSSRYPRGAGGGAGTPKARCRPRAGEEEALEGARGEEEERAPRPAPFVSWGVPQLPGTGTGGDELPFSIGDRGQDQGPEPPPLYLGPPFEARPGGLAAAGGPGGLFKRPWTMHPARARGREKPRSGGPLSSSSHSPAPSPARRARGRHASAGGSPRRGRGPGRPRKGAGGPPAAPDAQAGEAEGSASGKAEEPAEAPCTCHCHLLELQAAAAQRLPGLRKLRPIVPSTPVPVPAPAPSADPAGCTPAASIGISTPGCAGGRCVCQARAEAGTGAGILAELGGAGSGPGLLQVAALPAAAGASGECQQVHVQVQLQGASCSSTGSGESS
eukprot:tig00020556_g10979.t1